MMSTDTTAGVDIVDLRGKVQEMYRRVAEEPAGEFHFEMGSGLAERLGYPASDLAGAPSEAVESFAGVGFYFDLADLRFGETVLDLGSGSGMDSFIAAARVGPDGGVIGVDMTDSQLEKAERLRLSDGYGNVTFRKGFLEDLPIEDASVDCVISNGVINLCPEKDTVFREVARVLPLGGRLALADIVTEIELPANVTCNATLWAACIGGAAQKGHYLSTIEAAGFRVKQVRGNDYRFLSRSAQGASRDYGVGSISLVAERVR